MIKNLIIISLLLVIVLGWSADDFLNYISLALDKIQEVVYYVQNEVK
jgi:type III secretory pathway component EscS